MFSTYGTESRFGSCSRASDGMALIGVAVERRSSPFTSMTSPSFKYRAEFPAAVNTPRGDQLNL